MVFLNGKEANRSLTEQGLSVPNAWEVWILSEKASRDVSHATTQAKEKEVARLREKLLYQDARSLLNLGLTGEALEGKLSEQIRQTQADEKLVPYVNLVRYFALSGHLDSHAAVTLLMFIVARQPANTFYKKLKEEDLPEVDS